MQGVHAISRAFARFERGRLPAVEKIARAFARFRVPALERLARTSERIAAPRRRLEQLAALAPRADRNNTKEKE